MSKVPVNFQSSATASGHFDSTWTITSSEQSALCSIPKEFNGSGGGFSPEDLFLQASINCFIGTFKVFAKASHVDFSTIAVKGHLVVDKDSLNKMIMKSIHLDIHIHGASRPDRVDTLVNKTIKDGFILNSIKSELTTSLTINS